MIKGKQELKSEFGFEAKVTSKATTEERLRKRV